MSSTHDDWRSMVKDIGAMVIHDCTKYDELNPDRYNHKLYRYGRALYSIAYVWPDGVISMDNEEYGIRVLYCPFCGVDLEKEPKLGD